MNDLRICREVKSTAAVLAWACCEHEPPTTRTTIARRLPVANLSGGACLHLMIILIRGSPSSTGWYNSRPEIKHWFCLWYTDSSSTIGVARVACHCHVFTAAVPGNVNVYILRSSRGSTATTTSAACCTDVIYVVVHTSFMKYWTHDTTYLHRLVQTYPKSCLNRIFSEL